MRCFQASCHGKSVLCALFLSVTVFISPLFSQTKEGATSVATTLASFPSGTSGEYVVYRDYSWKAPTWIGFLYYDDSTWGAVSVTPSTNSRVSVLFRTEEADGQLVLTGQQVISDITSSDVPVVNYLMSLLPDLFAWRKELSVSPSVKLITQGRSPLLPSGLSLSKNLATFGGPITLTFSPEVAVFNMASMTTSEKKPIFELARSGRVGSSGDSVFFSFLPQEAVKKTPSLISLKQSPKEIRTVDGVNLTLDGQWTMVADNTFFLGNTAVLIVDTIDLGLMQIPQANIPLSFVRLFSLSSAAAWADPSKLIVTGTKDNFRIENIFFDVESGTLNRDIKKCILSPDGKKCTVISLSVSDASWKNNEAYFTSLF